MELPWVLGKATNDGWWYYACRLKTGEYVRFEHAAISKEGEWVTLYGVTFPAGPPPELKVCGFDRGLVVPLDNIAWLVDGGS